MLQKTIGFALALSVSAFVFADDDMDEFVDVINDVSITTVTDTSTDSGSRYQRHLGLGFTHGMANTGAQDTGTVQSKGDSDSESIRPPGNGNGPGIGNGASSGNGANPFLGGMFTNPHNDNCNGNGHTGNVGQDHGNGNNGNNGNGHNGPPGGGNGFGHSDCGEPSPSG